MRIIAGTARGIQLETLDGLETRPTADRVKEALFSMIQFDIEGRCVLDLFGGSGQLALEALSRGAAKATILDSSRGAVDVIMANAKKTKLFDRCRISCADYTACAGYASGNDKYGVIFLDPPYASDLLPKSLALIARAGLLTPGGIIACESEADETSRPTKKKHRISSDEAAEKERAEIADKVFGGDEALAASYNVIKSNVYGRTRITLLSAAK